MPKVSVIIPVYKAKETITACLDSVLAQTLDGMEVVLVDDHGGDGTIEAARGYAAAHSGPVRFRFTETEANSGPGIARNVGVAAATGDFVAFLDADDTLSPDFCRSLYEAAVAADADIAFGHISFDQPDGTSKVCHNPAVADGPFEGKAKRDYLCRFKSYFTTYIYRRTFLTDNEIRFPDTHSAEDSCFLICSLLCARRIASAPEACYHYAIQPGSVSQRRDPARWRNRIASFRQMEAFARTHNLFRPYRHVIRWMSFKKGWLLAGRDFFQNNLFSIDL